MRKQHKGVTLLEVTVAVLIVALLISIIIPVSIGVRKYSQRAVCTSNLRQIHASWMMYLQDYAGSPTNSYTWAQNAAQIVPYLKDERILLCPLDLQDGASFSNSRIRTSYYYPGRGSDENSMAAFLLKLESNPGVFACMFHGRCRFYPPSTSGQYTTAACVGTILRCHLDGSVKTAQFAPRCKYDNQGNLVSRAWLWWYLLSDQPCPQEVCEFAFNWGACHSRDTLW